MSNFREILTKKARLSCLYTALHHKESKSTLRSIFEIGIGSFIGTVFSFTFNILSGRLLGPGGYGEFTLIQSIAMFLYIPMLLGFHTSLVKYNAEKNDIERSKHIISTIYILVFICTLISVILLLYNQTKIMIFFHIDYTLYLYSVIFAVFFVYYTITTETLRSLKRMRDLALSRVMYPFTLLLTLFIFIKYDFISSKSVLFATYTAYVITASLILYNVRKFIKLKFDTNWARKLIKYSNYAAISGISFTIYSNIDKIFINSYLGTDFVGIYTAYNYSFTSFIFFLVSIFTTVFFPYASSHKEKILLYKNINKFLPLTIIALLPLIIGFGTIILSLFGKNYPFSIDLIILFSINSALMASYGIYGIFISSTGVNGIKIGAFIAIIMTITNAILNILLIPLMGVKGAIIATMLSYFISILLINSKKCINFSVGLK